ncbi:succinylglutamate desuccinylase/aspartoacylase family protein [Marinobacter bryozoorum]|uniref:succinylglutamate desuccinylase/aspartoacylase family protein n=1 Tax=Marinobacter bryozoorum TaxID=256324 RepID=UPI0020048F1E|nr:succinylglutamate desuccinylase/aspartoacylase family protein [Marinobacter bryozoorum]MCK7544385.1 succinylglutamate desuccinylase/aspartoacylase family protein [Marinobacter bryozoorum]
MRNRLTQCLLPPLLASLPLAPVAWSQPPENAPKEEPTQPVQVRDEGTGVIDPPTMASVEAADTASGESEDSEAPAVIELPEDESVEDIAAESQNSPAGEDAPASSDDMVAPSDAADIPDGNTVTGDREGSVEVIPETRPAQAKPFPLLSGEVLPGTTARLAWSPGIQIAGLSQPTPVLVVNGDKPGPVLCMTGAVHGDELNGIEIIRRVIYELDPEALSGTVVGIPIVNLQGFQQGSRYLADRRDLNRYFPGSEDGSLAHRIAHSLFEQVILNCDMLVDIHTGSLKRTNLPQLRADMDNPDVVELSKGFDSMVVVHSSGGSGMLRKAATEAGIPAVTMEVGESMRIQEAHIDAGVNSLISLMEKQGMTARLFQWGAPEPVYYQSHWIRANQGGILFSDVKLGAYVTEGTVLGTVSDPITNEQSDIRADADGRIIGMAVDQVVMAGFAAYHLGSRAETEEEVE